MNIGIIGYGYWGPNLVRNFSLEQDCTVSCIADSRAERLKIAERLYPSMKTTTRPEDILMDNAIEAVIIATPVHTHYQLARSAMERKKHVLVEKPMTMSHAEAKELVQLAQEQGITLMVDHTFLYTGAVKKMKEIIGRGDLGNIQYYDSTRINLGLFQHDINVLWDLAPHDIAILLHLIDEKPTSVQAIGVTHTNNGIENIAYLTLYYQSGMIAHCSCSWSSPVKVRTTYIGGTQKMIVYDDMEGTEKVKVYDTGFEIKTDEEKHRTLVDYRTGDIYTPKIDTKEALAEMAHDFVMAVKHEKEPISSWKVGYDVVNILESAQISIKSNGSKITLLNGLGGRA
ncbi:MAG TPA: Gfo/Idh/MocA family oxidoreductase [Syntrophorhabdaceae bacterium]|nr:Gfo/Idh/MocA family oxidoreductase [Syntrophorhabdaceae bacterium]